MNIKALVRKITVLLILCYTCVNTIMVYNIKAEEISTSQATEEQLINIINEYGEGNIIFEDGLVINIGEEIILDEATARIGVQGQVISNNNEILMVNENSIVGLIEGTTFLIVKNNEVYHVIQVYVKGEMPIAINETVETRGHHLVFVDAGHGGSDPGTVERNNSGQVVPNGMKEKDLNLTIALKIRDKLKAKGVQVVMNRETDKFVDFRDTASMANKSGADVFVSIHNNSTTSSSVNGIETFYTKEIDVNYGRGIHSRLITNTGANDRGLKWDNYYVTNHTTMPAVLVEGGFLTNEAETAKLKQDYYQEIIANSVVDGICEYLGVPQSNLIPAERISGPSRYETAIEIFNKGWKSADTAILVTGENYPDALSATPLAAKHDAPILLAKNASLQYQQELTNALKNKGVKNVIIIGSEGIIPKVIESELSNIGINSRRIAGSDRYETSLAIAKEVGINSGEVVVASGQNFPDGLSIASIAAKKQMPILLIREQHIPGNTKAYMDSANISKTYLLGSEGLIPNSVASQLKNVERLAGKDRYATNENIFNRFKHELSLDHLYIASSLDFPDALATSALAAKTNSFVVLSYPNYAAASLKTIVNSSKDTLDKVYVIGSRGLIPDDTFISAGIDIIK